MNKLILIFISLGLVSCARLTGSGGSQLSFPSYKKKYVLVDKSGRFTVNRETGLVKGKNRYITKNQVFVEDKLLEESTALGIPGTLKGELPVLRPLASKYMVYFEKQAHSAEQRVNPKKRNFSIKLTSPEPQWNGTKNYSFPKKGSSVVCYFSQVMECAYITGFIKKALKREAGQMNFQLIWDGYPYIMEQYLNLPDEPVSLARLSYDGKNREGEKRFSLSVGSQVIFYMVDKNGYLSKMFWVSQGLSMTEINAD